MKKATVITGASNSGKSWLAKNLASLDYKNIVEVDAVNIKCAFPFNECNENTDCVIIDGIHGASDLNQLLYIVSLGLWVKKPGKNKFNIYPKIIATLDHRSSSSDIKKLGLSFTRRIELIEMVDGIGHRIEL